LDVSSPPQTDATPQGRPAPTRKLFAGAKRCDGVVWFGNVDWWYHNRGHASVRMATRIARHVPTVYINSIGMRLPVPGKTEIAWRRYQRKLKSLLKGLRRDEATGLWIYSPLFVPRYSPRMIELNGMLLAAQVRLVCRRLGLRRPSAGITMPTMTPAVERLPWVKVAFERCDDFTTLPEADAPLIDALERRLLAISDHVAYVSHDLMERERERVADAQFLGHGVDCARMAAARPLDGPLPAAPVAIRDLPRPIVGFFGGMDDYRMDAELMIRIARRAAPGTLLLIGPEQMDLSRVKAEPNVRHIGQLPPEQLADYAAHFDVGVIPFLRNEFNLRSNPIKLKEYLALGFPVVATDLPAYEPYAGLIATAETHEQFLDALGHALAEDDPELPRRRRAAVAGDDWDRIAARMARMLAVPGFEPEADQEIESDN
jgi:glycosyltransferase involved in cell wall biosynthesis